MQCGCVLMASEREIFRPVHLLKCNVNFSNTVTQIQLISNLFRFVKMNKEACQKS